jgi:hypothetical protein
LSSIKKIINVPYSPQFNPIEFTFNTLKSKIKCNNVTTKKQLDKVLDKHIKQSNKNGHVKYYDHTYKNIKNVINWRYSFQYIKTKSFANNWVGPA